MLDSLLEPRSVGLEMPPSLGAPMNTDAFVDFTRKWMKDPCGALLLSGGDLDCSRYSIAARDPYMIFKSKGSQCTVTQGERSVSQRGNPLDLLDALLGSFRPRFSLVAEPFAGGALGYFAYDLKNQVEKLPRTAQDDLGLPDIWLFWPREILVHDRYDGKVRHLRFVFEDKEHGGIPEGAASKATLDSSGTVDVGTLQSNFSHSGYLEAVGRIRRYIGQGDVYQVNLSQRFEAPLRGDVFTLWRRLFGMNPAPFYAFLQCGGHQVLSTSMERFLLRRGSMVETRPIKGTRPRGATPGEDEAFRADLLANPKDDAELSMIVDLLRNDLGRVCCPRTVRVLEHKRLEAYQNVYHLVSVVRGCLAPEASHVDLLRATFPGGSITGCPKIRAMEIIDELEPHVRHVYTGSIGYLGWHENMDLSIAIRTALVHDGRCLFSVGGGIVYDSKEEDEYLETLHKGRTLFQLIESLGEKTHEPRPD